MLIICQIFVRKLKITIRLDSEFVAVLAEPNDRKTVKAAAKCLNASVSGPENVKIR